MCSSDLESANFFNLDLSKSNVVIQGFGNVGSYTAKFLDEMGSKIIAVSDVNGGLHEPDGFDVPSLIEFNSKNRTIKGCGQGSAISNEKLIGLECDFLIPAALGGVIHKMNVDELNCKVVVEAANGPVTPTADKKLFEKNIHVVPDKIGRAHV